MHRLEFVHRDLKLLNIFLSSNSRYPRVKIGDFGLASKLRTGETFTKRCGTVAFMSPEMLKGEPSDFKADIWSLGIILYSIIATYHPFEPTESDDSKNDLKQ